MRSKWFIQSALLVRLQKNKFHIPKDATLISPNGLYRLQKNKFHISRDTTLANPNGLYGVRLQRNKFHIPRDATLTNPNGLYKNQESKSTKESCKHIVIVRFRDYLDKILDRCGNDPSAGSPTETLLRLHLPLNDKV